MRKVYKRPPIVEVVLAVYLKPALLGLRNEHIGLFWQRIRDRFPIVQQNAPIGEFQDAPHEVFPLPRYWFIAENRTYLVQLQRNALIINMRRQKEDYPHFDAVKLLFDEIFAKFSEFLILEKIVDVLNIDTCELTYVNHLAPSKHWTGPNDIGKIIPSFAPLNPGLAGAKLEGVNSINVFRIDEDLSVKLTLRTVAAGDPPQPRLIFEQRVTGRLKTGVTGEKASVDDWFGRAHDITGKCFGGLTDSDIQHRVWKMMETS